LTIPDSGRDVEVSFTKEVSIGRLDPANVSFSDIDLTRDDALEKGAPVARPRSPGMDARSSSKTWAASEEEIHHNAI
jgi:hypothetical protein